MLAPSDDQVEVSVIGPGYGECILVHIGDGKWVIIDSCINNLSGRPAALEYLENIGVDPSKAVVFILATHWHDDHVRGLAQTLSACPKASFCCSSALSNKEFLISVLPYEERNTISGGSGIKELSRILKLLELRTKSGDYPKRAMANKRVFRLAADMTTHGNECNIWTLSPCDKQYEKFLAEIATLVPEIKTTKRRATPQLQNNLSVVLWIEIGDIKILLGADLEETSEPDTGWSVIVSSTEKPEGKAHIFKIPHHGSVTSHNDDVWTEMLITSPFAALTPFNRGSVKIPNPDDVKRILKKSENSYSTSTSQPKKLDRKRSKPVEKMIKETVKKIRPAEPKTGQVRFRNGGNATPNDWGVDLISTACHLEKLSKTA